jgi:hypothetical protein
MAKAQFLQAQDIEDVEIYDVEHGEPEEATQAEKKTENIFSALSGDAEAYLMIYREITGYRDKELITSVPADKYDLGELVVFLQGNYGGGDYRIIGYKDKKIAANQLIKIAHKIKSAGEQPSETMGVMDAMRQMMQENQRLIMQLSERGQGGPQKTTRDMLEELMIMKEVMGNNSPQVDPMAMMTQTLGMLKDLGVVGGDNQSESLGGNDQLSAMMGMVGKLAESAAKQPQQLPQPQLPQQFRQPLPPQHRPSVIPQRLQNPLPRPNLRPQIDPSLIDQELRAEMIKNPMLKYGLEMLIVQAKEKIDAGEVAEKVINFLPENDIKAFLLAPKSFETLCSLKSEVMEHKEWVLDLIEHLKAAFGMESKHAEQWAEDTPESMAEAMPNFQAPTSAQMQDAFLSGEIEGEVVSTLSPDLQVEPVEPIITENSSGDDNVLHSTNDTRGASGDAGNSQPNGETGKTV